MFLKGFFIKLSHNLVTCTTACRAKDDIYAEIPVVNAKGLLLHTQTTLPPLLLSTDLDTSEDLSAELDRSHGFFTASDEGERIKDINYILKTVVLRT